MSVMIKHGDCRDVLRMLPDRSVHCCVTSPPYFGLRDYGDDGQIGLEPTPDAYVAELVVVFREVRRVLRDDGTLWLNLGDSYSSGGRSSPQVAHGGLSGPANPEEGSRRAPVIPGIKPKDLIGIPWSVAFALRADGWYLRQDIIWSKPNPMPESVTDRCTKAHEYIFLMSKSARYFYDGDAIREPYAEVSLGRYQYEKQGTAPTARQPGGDLERRIREKGIQPLNDAGRNKRSVWEVATLPYSEAHFATFPPALIEPCIKAGTSEKGCCSKCGAPLVRVNEIEKSWREDAYQAHQSYGPGSGNRMARAHSGGGMSQNVYRHSWSPSCACDAPVAPCTVLDPFAGAGTTGMVTDRLRRNAILIELNQIYAGMIEDRIKDDAGMFAELI